MELGCKSDLFSNILIRSAARFEGVPSVAFERDFIGVEGADGSGRFWLYVGEGELLSLEDGSVLSVTASNLFTSSENIRVPSVVLMPKPIRGRDTVGRLIGKWRGLVGRLSVKLGVPVAS